MNPIRFWAPCTGCHGLPVLPRRPGASSRWPLLGVTEPSAVVARVKQSHQSHLRGLKHPRRRGGIQRQSASDAQVHGADASGSLLDACLECLGMPKWADGPGPSVHFIGAGGAGLAPLAMVALDQGWIVTGSDQTAGERLQWIAQAGGRVAVGHDLSNLYLAGSGNLPSLVVVSSAIPASNVEVMAARAEGLQVLKRDAWLTAVTAGYRVVGVAGTHGKTTTTAMLACILQELWPGQVTAVVGGNVEQFPNSRGYLLPKPLSAPSLCQPLFVCEADEYDLAFLGLSPDVAVITNVELDHVDCFEDEKAVQEAFAQFVLRIRPGGTLILCSDDRGARMVGKVSEPVLMAQARQSVTYGSQPADWMIQCPGGKLGSSAAHEVLLHDESLGDLLMPLRGQHNAMNSLAAVAAAGIVSGIIAPGTALRSTVSKAVSAISAFKGVRRRLQLVGTWRGPHGLHIRIIDDYAHHPTAVLATITAARDAWPGEEVDLVAVFQPHTASRLSRFMERFADALSKADAVFVLDTFAARSEDLLPEHHTQDPKRLMESIAGLSSGELCRRVEGPLEQCAESIAAELTARAANAQQKGSHRHIVLVLLGAGDVTLLAPFVANALELAGFHQE